MDEEFGHTRFASLGQYVTDTGSGVALTKVVLPAGEAVPALPDLDSMGINCYHVYPTWVAWPRWRPL